MRTLLVFALLACVSSAQGEMFKCRDGNGRTSYQERPCDEGAKALEVSVASQSGPHSNLPCDENNIRAADYKLAAYFLMLIRDTVNARQAGGAPDAEVARFRRASNEARNVPVPRCMEPARGIAQKYLDFTADRLSAYSKSQSFQSADSRSKDLLAEYKEALANARATASEQNRNVWSK